MPSSSEQTECNERKNVERAQQKAPVSDVKSQDTLVQVTETIDPIAKENMPLVRNMKKGAHTYGTDWRYKADLSHLRN